MADTKDTKKSAPKTTISVRIDPENVVFTNRVVHALNTARDPGAKPLNAADVQRAIYVEGLKAFGAHHDLGAPVDEEPDLAPVRRAKGPKKAGARSAAAS